MTPIMQNDRALIEAIKRGIDPYNYPPNAPSGGDILGQKLMRLAQGVESTLQPQRGTTGLEDVVGLLPRWTIANPLKAVGEVLQLDKPAVEAMAQQALDAAQSAYKQPKEAIRQFGQAVSQGVRSAAKDPVQAASDLSIGDMTGGVGFLGKLGMAAMMPNSPNFSKAALNNKMANLSNQRKGYPYDRLNQINDELVGDLGAYLETDTKAPIDFSDFTIDDLKAYASTLEDPDRGLMLLKEKIELEKTLPFFNSDPTFTKRYEEARAKSMQKGGK